MSRTEIEVNAATEQTVQEPSMYLVSILNDDYTPYEFVVVILSGVFKHPIPDAVELAGKAHEQGRAVVGCYTKEIAETLVDKATRLARGEGFPLSFAIEPEPQAKPSSGPTP